MLLLLLACGNPTVEIDAPPVIPAAPMPVGLRVDPAVDEVVAALYAGADSFSAEGAGEAMRAVERLGPAALPELLRSVQAATDDRALHSLCSGIQALDVREPLAAPILLATLDRADTTVAACGSAAARTLALGAPEAKQLVELTRDAHRPCWVREAIAGALREPSLCAELVPRFDQRDCSGRVAMRAAGACTEAIAPLLERATRGDPARREAALAGLLGQASIPSASLEPLREALRTGPLDNGAALAIQLLGRHGTPADRELLLQVAARDPHGSGGFHARTVQHALLESSR